ncbi:2-oxoacid:ferredoxin oxidoreductase subunit beta [Engelhardtia mirabilis]|uniref:2-oxoglutarate oxidoreductase subunit KorB n=1 Tax=Engelhardtia mirabilis TaxID=2528011 RepID=A0A518BFT4_9BACT|nr:2-oxoglutarate oxidoreductase subunit KorB [Planctomycetes bacterium Pla133]QDV00173.1 2-oxoglutarate oxidoreductase subunit KorB [Planctomycetes bacterium Pla86]
MTQDAHDAGSATLTKKDFKSDQDVRWCPGCGDYSILNSVQGVLADLGIPKHQFCVVSGIGCSSRFPYYMNTYGFHSIHGRAPAIATGVKTANPELSVWMVTGDGDGLSIGGNHTIHMLRRNVGVKVLLFNNQIYGLTKGQYSPTSPVGLKTKSTPYGSIDRPFNPVQLALGAGATFVARTMDTHPKHMEKIFHEAAKHEGTAFIEIFQNCVIFNDGAFEGVAGRKVRDDRTVDLVPGEPMIYGSDHDKGLRFEGFDVVPCSADEAEAWDPTRNSTAPAQLLAELDADPTRPTAVGIFRRVDAPVFEERLNAQVDKVLETKGPGKLRDLLYTRDTWQVD